MRCSTRCHDLRSPLRRLRPRGAGSLTSGPRPAAILLSPLIAATMLLSALQLSSAADQAPPAAQPSASEQLHWSFRPLHRPAPPTTNDTTVSGIDKFVLARLEKLGLTFAPEADRRTLARRLSLDLIGLPPTPEDVEKFIQDTSPQAYEHLVDRLLASPHYGERWGRQWLDVTGYADSNGYIRHDSPRPLAYHYRDYVIRSLNEDKPYDQLWVEQLAGDELVNYHTAQQLTPTQVQTLAATHYLRNAPDGTDNTEGNEITRVIERYAVLESQLQTTMSAMFGMTIDCARCHDHKFDPIPQSDYYSLQAIFYPAFNVKSWVQPKDRWIYAAGQAEIAAWRHSIEQADREVAALQKEFREWLFQHRPPGQVVYRDDFSAPSLAMSWSGTAPGDSLTPATTLTAIDSSTAPAAKVDAGRLAVIAAGSGDSRWLATQRKFDWTPDKIGHWIQVTFDLVESRGPNGQPAERVGYYIALHDYDDNSEVQGGNILLDGNPAGGANAVLDYPGSDQQGLGTVGTTGYLPGRNLGVRITRTAENEYLLQQLVDGSPEEKTLRLTADQLPDGAFGFELCCSRSFTIDNLLIESSPPESDKSAPTAEQAEFAQQLAERNQQLATALAAVNAKRLPEPGKLAWATDLSSTPPDVPLLKRGEYDQPGKLVPPGPLSALSDPDNVYQPGPVPSDARTTGRRLAFARWATRPNSRAAALLARVHADRLWRGHFGQGLVPTPENFGASGLEPTHPELLEWLAAELVSTGWSQKALHRAIVRSRTYRQESSASPASIEKDPQNAAYSRFPAHRLEAEQIRDSLLAVSGVLNPKAGGPAVEIVDPGTRQIVLPAPQGAGPHEVDRRSIYIRYRRSQPLSFLRAFDQANPDPNCVVRATSTVVAQSLAMLNSEFATRMGREFASRIINATELKTDDERIRFAFETALIRPPTAAEALRCQEFLQAQQARRSNLPAAAAQQAAWSDLCRMLLATNEFLYLQ